MRLQIEYSKRLLITENRVKQVQEILEEKEAQVARLSGAISSDTSIAMAMNLKTEVIIRHNCLVFF